MNPQLEGGTKGCTKGGLSQRPKARWSMCAHAEIGGRDPRTGARVQNVVRKQMQGEYLDLDVEAFKTAIDLNVQQSYEAAHGRQARQLEARVIKEKALKDAKAADPHMAPEEFAKEAAKFDAQHAAAEEKYL